MKSDGRAKTGKRWRSNKVLLEVNAELIFQDNLVSCVFARGVSQVNHDALPLDKDSCLYGNEPTTPPSVHQKRGKTRATATNDRLMSHRRQSQERDQQRPRRNQRKQLDQQPKQSPQQPEWMRLEHQQQQQRQPHWRPLTPSSFATNTVNPIRRLVDVMSVEPHPDKPLLKFHIGDPTVTGALPTHENVAEAVAEALKSGRYNGYGPAVGFPEVRRQLADFLNVHKNKQDRIHTDDIVLTSGCSHALQLALEALVGRGQNILVPRPGFPLYATLMEPHNVELRYYNLLMECDWEADLNQMESLIDTKTAAIVVNNPNNPTGAVHSRRHLRDILRLAERHRLPIVADEIYGDLVFGGAEFHPMHTLTPKVPMLTCDGISKRYLIPGWRLGWLIVHDVDGSMSNVRRAICQLAQKLVGPCALMQGALPRILGSTPASFFQRTRTVLAENVQIIRRELADAPGLRSIPAKGAMYIMIGVELAAFPDFAADQDPVAALCRALIAEQSLYCLPGSAFHFPDAFRLVTTYPPDVTLMACRRLLDFCRLHYRPVRPTTFDPDGMGNGPDENRLA